GGDRKIVFVRQCPRLLLGEITEGKAQIIRLLLRRRKEEVALVLEAVFAAVKPRPSPHHLAADVMAGGERPRAEILRRRQKIAEFHRLVTTHAGDRRLAAKVAVGELLHHLVAKPALIVEDIMGNTDGIGNTAGIMNILPGAA